MLMPRPCHPAWPNVALLDLDLRRECSEKTSGGTGALTQAVPGACPPLVPSRACLPLSWTGPLPPWGTRAG
eukprot:CAMPEP_0180412410 /NCGR_PEP_ID=MMETSP0989-20121125/44524_1 /TAXON_ID=697907 /ORGANISM="non described non described, Strain CCMP2293" /LENGTH=70 /DNA_ID=CAMNT_0022416871 /DNA_START=364 /DNA_END=573 /DNA_ORIENTATION=-